MLLSSTPWFCFPRPWNPIQPRRKLPSHTPPIPWFCFVFSGLEGEVWTPCLQTNWQPLGFESWWGSAVWHACPTWPNASTCTHSTIPDSMVLLCFSGVRHCLTQTVWTSCPFRLPEAFADWTSVPHLTGRLVKLYFSVQLYLPPLRR